MSHFHCFHLSPFTVFTSFQLSPFHRFTPFTFHSFTPFHFVGLARADPTNESLYTQIYILALLVFTLSHFHCFHLSPFSPFSPFTFSQFSLSTPFHFAGLARADPTNESLYTKLSHCHISTVFTFHPFQRFHLSPFTVFIFHLCTFHPFPFCRAGPG